ncbi:hypothetical protein UY3_12963 [Chelonia mydas]|uniref:Uncharacterized protein n=1 Tax=Chelonia mydas TaxID=8469 RepID=M7BCP2_CHEMY|nr:hypothetical protein UY3_12963 [Chelonia mydas]
MTKSYSRAFISTVEIPLWRDKRKPKQFRAVNGLDCLGGGKTKEKRKVLKNFSSRDLPIRKLLEALNQIKKQTILESQFQAAAKKVEATLRPEEAVAFLNCAFILLISEETSIIMKTYYGQIVSMLGFKQFHTLTRFLSSSLMWPIDSPSRIWITEEITAEKHNSCFPTRSNRKVKWKQCRKAGSPVFSLAPVLMQSSNLLLISGKRSKGRGFGL